MRAASPFTLRSLGSPLGTSLDVPLGADDAALYRAIRLEALEAHPEAFGASFADEAAQPLTFFAGRLAGNTVFGGFDGAMLLGAAGFRAQTGLKHAHKGLLWGMYVRPAARGTGLARELVDAVLAHAQGRVELVQLTVVADNVTARRLYEARGFVAYGMEARSLKVDGRYLDEVLMAKMLG